MMCVVVGMDEFEQKVHPFSKHTMPPQVCPLLREEIASDSMFASEVHPSALDAQTNVRL